LVLSNLSNNNRSRYNKYYKNARIEYKNIRIRVRNKTNKLPPILEPQTKLMVIKTLLIQNPSLILIPVLIIVSAILRAKGLK
jgi:hypothetical protein